VAQDVVRKIEPRWAGVPLILVAASPLPLLVLHGQVLWHRPHYQFAPLAPLGAAVLAARGVRGLGPLAAGRPGVAALLVGLSWVLLAAATLLYSPWLGAVAALAVTAAVIYGVGGGRLLRALVPAWAFLWVAVPPPLGLDAELVTRLQSVATRWSSAVLDLLDVYHVPEGNVLQVAGGRLLIGEACSGIRSLAVVLSCTLFLILRARRHWVRAVTLLLAATGWVLLGNVVRIVAVAYLGARWGIDVGEGWRHEAIGLVVLLAVLGLVASTDRLLGLASRAGWWLWREMRRARQPPPSYWEPGPGTPVRLEEKRLTPPPGPLAPTRLPALRTAWPASWPVALAFGVLGLVQLAGLRLAWADLSRFSAPALAWALDGLTADDMPAQWGPFVRQEFKTAHAGTDPTGAAARFLPDLGGKSSRVWLYQFLDRVAAVSVDYPFAGWHELSG
jgi:exosortase